MSLQIYINGTMYAKEDAKISVYDHGLLYGDGVFEGIRSYHGRVFRLKEHIERLYDSAKAIYLKIPMSQDEMCAAVEETLRINKISDGYVRLVVTRGVGSLGLDLRKTSNPNVIIIADSIQLYPKELYDKGLEIITASTIRNHPQATNPRVKSLNYLNNVMARFEGTLAGCEEVLMLNHKGEVAECSGDNIFVVKKGNVVTPPLSAGILGGITRDAVIELCGQLKIGIKESSMTKHDLFIADEMFLTGTAAELIPVIKLDGRTIGDGKPGPVFRRLWDAFQKLVREG
jgi:branched-chain amino acid aminotransferase